ncbi:Apoptosis inhibitor 5, partial [Linnemannia zychae]
RSLVLPLVQLSPTSPVDIHPTVLPHTSLAVYRHRQMADLDTIYSAHNEITDAGENAPQVPSTWKRTLVSLKALKERKGQRYLQHSMDSKALEQGLNCRMAIDGLFDLCEDEITSVRRAAIKALPSLCKDGPQHTIKIADVLCQLLQLDGEDLVIVQGALQTLLEQNPREVLAVLFRQGIKGELRDKTLSFINNQVVASFQTRLSEDPEIERFFVDEIQKAMSSVSDSELEAFAKIIMQTQLYQTGALDLVGLSHIYMAHITSEGRWKIVNPESIKRVLVAGKLSMPLFQRNISADPLLEFFASNILPCSEFKQLANEQRAKFLRLFADSITSGHPSPAVLSRVGRLVSDLLVMIVPAKQDGSSTVEFVQVEYLLFILNYFIKDPDLLERDELVARFRNLYNSTQIQLSRIKNEIKIASATASRDANQEAEAKRLTRIQAIHSNVHALVAEFLRPKTLRTKVILHPSWKPTPEVQPAVAKKGASNPAPRKTPNLPTKPAAKVTPGSSAKVTAQSNTRSGAMPMPQQPQNKPSHPQQQQGPSKKRKAEPESNTNQKKPKITRPHGPSTVGSTPVEIQWELSN